MELASPAGASHSFGPCEQRVARDCAYHAQKNELKPWLKEQWCIPPKKDAAFVCNMEDVLEVYKRPYDPKCPLICMDEIPKQLLADLREPQPIQPGLPERFDYEYQRNGVADLFMLFEPLVGK